MALKDTKKSRKNFFKKKSLKHSNRLWTKTLKQSLLVHRLYKATKSTKHKTKL